MITTIDFVPGDVVRVHQTIKEESSKDKGQMRSRTQIFEGTVLSIRGRGENKSFTVRKLVGDVAVERIWPIMSPSVEKVVVKAHSKTRIRRAKLYYLRNGK